MKSFVRKRRFQAFVSCTLSAKYVGLVLIAYGVCDAIGSISFAQLVKFVGRWPCFVIASLINYGSIITMLIWKPSENQVVVLFVLAGLWGLADAVWQTQINAFYGLIFSEKDEAAFSNHRLWESTGFTIFYVISPYILVRTSLIILLSCLTLGMFGYAVTEYRLRKNGSMHEQVNPA